MHGQAFWRQHVSQATHCSVRLHPQEDGSAETAAQNILAIALTLVLALAAGSILWRLALVSWALFSAGVRYSVVAVLLLIMAMFFF